jgi:anti-sigma B factor antagonist
MADRHAPELSVTSESIPEGEVVTPAGDVDLSGSPVLRNELRRVQQKRPKRIIVELSRVGYMDSTGLATLVEAMQQGRKFGTRIVLCALTDRVRSIIEIARLDSVFVIAPSREAARTA